MANSLSRRAVAIKLRELQDADSQAEGKDVGDFLSSHSIRIPLALKVSQNPTKKA